MADRIRVKSLPKGLHGDESSEENLPEDLCSPPQKKKKKYMDNKKFDWIFSAELEAVRIDKIVDSFSPSKTHTHCGSSLLPPKHIPNQQQGCLCFCSFGKGQ